MSFIESWHDIFFLICDLWSWTKKLDQKLWNLIECLFLTVFGLFRPLLNVFMLVFLSFNDFLKSVQVSRVVVWKSSQCFEAKILSFVWSEIFMLIKTLNSVLNEMSYYFHWLSQINGTRYFHSFIIDFFFINLINWI